MGIWKKFKFWRRRNTSLNDQKHAANVFLGSLSTDPLSCSSSNLVGSEVSSCEVRIWVESQDFFNLSCDASTEVEENLSGDAVVQTENRFLATENSFRSIGLSYRLGFSTVREIVLDVCDATWKKLGPIAMPLPTEETWKRIATRFKDIWHFPNCIGATDGKHINIQCPINAGSTFFNYKGSHSVVLLALVDADYKFIAIDVGSYDRNSDGGVFSASEMGKRFHNKTFNVPESAPLVENGEPQPYVVIGDEAFPLKTNMLRPYSRKTLGDNEPNKIFNSRLSRARRLVENAFGILAARWRCFRRYLEVQSEFVDKIVLASCCLHNMLCADKTFEADTGSINLPEAALLNLGPIRKHSTRLAFQVREIFKEYFNSDGGSVAWQVPMVRRGRIHN